MPPMMFRKGGENEIIKLNTSVNEPGSSTNIQWCCGRSFASIKAMRIHRTKMGCLSRQRCKSQSEINKSIEGNQSQENYYSTQAHFVCQPNAPSVKGNAIRINWPKANDDRWKVFDEEVFFIFRNSLRGSVRVKLHSFTEIINVVCLEHIGAEDVQKGENILTANRRQREKGRLRAEERLQKKRLKEMPNERELVTRQLSEVGEKILIIARAENARKHRQKKRKARHNLKKKKTFKFTKKLFEGEKNGVLDIPKEDIEAHLRKNIPTHSPTLC